MLKNVVDSVKSVFGFKSRRQGEFDEAMLSLLNAIADSRLYLITQTPGELDTDKARSLAGDWNEAAVKVHRLHDELGERCLEFAKAFSGVKSRDQKRIDSDLEQIDEIFVKAGEFMKEGGKLV